MWKVSEGKTGDGGNAKRNCRKREGRRGKGGKERGETDGKKELQEVGGDEWEEREWRKGGGRKGRGMGEDGKVEKGKEKEGRMEKKWKEGEGIKGKEGRGGMWRGQGLACKRHSLMAGASRLLSVYHCRSTACHSFTAFAMVGVA